VYRSAVNEYDLTASRARRRITDRLESRPYLSLQLRHELVSPQTAVAVGHWNRRALYLGSLSASSGFACVRA
jgi:hypothetical protein